MEKILKVKGEADKRGSHGQRAHRGRLKYARPSLRRGGERRRCGPIEGAEEWLTSEDERMGRMKAGQRTPTGTISPTTCSRRMCT